MANRYAITLLHWITTIIIGSVLSGLFSPWMNSPQFNVTSLDVVVWSCIISGLFSLPLLLLALFLIPKFLKANHKRKHLPILLSAISTGFVLVGYLAAGFFLGGQLITLKYYSFVLVGFCISAILSSLIWTRMYKPDSNNPASEIEALDSDLLN
ncbi:MAG: hypothetical protein ACKVOK_03620 [Flavobacteriales bacterium]